MDRSPRLRLTSIVALTVAALLTACGGGGKASPAPTLAAASASTSAPTASATPSPSDSSTTADAGTTVTANSTALSADEIGAKCAGLAPTDSGSPTESSTPTDGTSPTDGSTGTDADGSDDSGGEFGNSMDTTGSGQPTAITSHGVVVVSCSEPVNALMAVDLVHGTDLWNHPLQAGNSGADSGQDTVSDYLLGIGDQNAYVLSVTSVAATGLKDAYVTRTVSAVSIQTGNTAWTQPLELDDRQNDSSTGAIIEVPGPTAGHREVVVVLSGNSAFDADTGHPLWRVPDFNSLVDSNAAQFVAYNLALFSGEDDNGQPQWGAVDVATGKIRWSQGIDETSISLRSDVPFQLVGNQIWFIGESGVDAYDVLSGNHTVHKLFPTSFDKVMATPTRTVALVDGTLRCFATGEWSRPLWSVDAGDVSPKLVTGTTLIVSAQSGDQMLSMADGSIIGPAPEGVPGDGPVVDGLQITGDEVFAYAPPT